MTACPDAVLIVGHTHPQVKRHGEISRGLVAKAAAQSAKCPLRDRYLSLPELLERRPAASRRLSRQGSNQTVPGVCGSRRQAVVLLHLYAKVLAEGPRLLVPFSNVDAMADATLRFLENAPFRLATRRKAFDYARPMFWPSVGRDYLEFFDQIAAASEKRLERRYLGAYTTKPNPIRAALAKSGKVMGGL